MTAPPIRLGINIDHVATLRNARGGVHPDPLRAAKLAVEAGADNITAHLREDRRHIRDDDIRRLMAELDCPLNFEMAATDEMRAIALKVKPHAACIVPERREERTTEGGLDAVAQFDALVPVVADLTDAGIQVSLFIAAEGRQIEAASRLGVPAIEIHTGACRVRVAVHQGRRSAGARPRAGSPCWPRAQLRDGGNHFRPTGDRRAEYRSLSCRRRGVRRAG
jgi:pyridoxine 5-phosphate synthase